MNEDKQVYETLSYISIFVSFVALLDNLHNLYFEESKQSTPVYKKHFVYGLYTEDRLFYIGSGNVHRLKTTVKPKGHTYKDEYLRFLEYIGKTPELRILSEHDYKQEALIEENRLIRELSQVERLVNTAHNEMYVQQSFVQLVYCF